ncbi:nuclease-related domain-containing protein [Bacillus sp. EB01]|uniref:nuclease-related domain-containing protein n=1 Tax=Bacillus sp. EB01 TaxID=1347086 RepID=UPI0005C641E9|nr:nuclease-related domain-containing protein [Bacillus sp. EB01]
MAYKIRCKSKKLVIYDSLAVRMKLSDDEWSYYCNLVKGFEGEVQFDGLTEQLQCECIVLNDLLLEVGGRLFQIDTLIITADLIYLFDVKTFDGEYFYDSREDRLFKRPKYEVDNPLTQLKRCETALRQLLRELGYSSFPINASVVFVNSEFTLFQAPLDRPFILPTQVYPFLRKLNNAPAGLGDKQWRLAEKLAALHQNESRYDKFPTYTFKGLLKGFRCWKCGSLLVTVVGKKCVCACGEEEKVVDAVIRHVREFQLLFPDEPITTDVIFDWCGKVRSKKRISVILKDALTKVGVYKGAYFK